MRPAYALAPYLGPQVAQDGHAVVLQHRPRDVRRGVDLRIRDPAVRNLDRERADAGLARLPAHYLAGIDPRTAFRRPRPVEGGGVRHAEAARRHQGCARGDENRPAARDSARASPRRHGQGARHGRDAEYPEAARVHQRLDERRQQQRGGGQGRHAPSGRHLPDHRSERDGEHERRSIRAHGGQKRPHLLYDPL